MRAEVDGVDAFDGVADGAEGLQVRQGIAAAVVAGSYVINLKTASRAAAKAAFVASFNLLF